MSRPGVAITGLGFITSIGLDRAAVTTSLRELRSGIVQHDYLPGHSLPITVAGLVPGFAFPSPASNTWSWPTGYDVPRETLRTLSPHGLYALCAAQQALRDAGWSDAEVRAEETGLFCASAGSPWLMGHHLKECHESNGARLHPLGIVNSIAGTLNFTLAAHFGIRGAVVGFVSACASSAHALGYAVDELRLGRLERALVIGAEDVSFDSHVPFHGMRALSRQSDPTTASRPFDVKRDGFVATGGAAALVVERADRARARGATTYAEILGWGQSADGYNVAISDPDGRGLALAMRRALADAQVAPSEIDYVNAHATSTPIGDRSEALALQAVFTANAAHPAISSTKALTGHGLSLAGAMETGFCALAIKEGFTPGCANLTEPDPACAGLQLPTTTSAPGPRRVLKNSSAFGGSNVCLVLGRAGPQETEVRT